ncbi:hypothetical protein GUITHDRAFT_148770 [Guillardia theta CCMP2712]|uniref:Uncharacterized protein n=1 Tax=Guillardia theta (strain CCMP2712) TaxID=905079 RepID=L1I7H2_GUITC|nr:hypothetical protein GUITHDRAFT_148770 [Guillardia theta CCMP2712]EKX32216.1 hypothetical protein GUITHDRAFT_148770 [Guillardia theta CCMP2712]|eukprot:XP_005819196.1 hypothetical protein GUITHDRAFT_148770 [Guillardia theta CCMP2712]
MAGMEESDGPKAGDIHRAAFCIRPEQDVDLHYIFNGMMEDIKSVASSNQESFYDVHVKRGEYVCFEMSQDMHKILTKIVQLSRLYSPGGLKDHFLGRQAKIRAFGVIVSGDRREFEDLGEKVRAFFVETSKSPRLSKNLIDQSIPFFLCLVNHENLYSQVTDLKLSVEDLKDSMEERFAQQQGLKESVEDLKQSMEAMQESMKEMKGRIVEELKELL